MAASGFTPISLYYSTTAAAAPTAGNLVSGELAINIADGKLYYKDSGGSVQLIASKAGATGDVVGPAGATANAAAIFDSTTGKLIKDSKVIITPVANSSTLTIANNKTVTVNNTLTLSGTDSTTMTFPSTSATIARTDSAQTFTGVQTFSSNPVLSGGTANGVLYLNGSSAATSGSALTFDGTTFQYTGAANFATSSGNVGIGTSSPSQRLEASFNDATTNRTNPVNVAAITATSTSSAGAVYNGFGPALVFRSQSYNGTVYNGSRVRMVINDNSVQTTQGASLAFDITNTKGGSPVEAMLLDFNGNLGIGTSSPSVKLHVSASAAGIAEPVWLNNSQAVGAGVGSRLAFTGTTSNNGLAAIDGAFAGATTADGGYMVFNTRAVTSGILTERMRLDASGNLGLGVTPSAWGSGYKAIEFGSGSIYGRANATDIYLTSNSYLGASTFIYKYAGAASYYSQAQGGHYWFNAPSGTAGNAITFTQAMTLDASGDWVVGGTTPDVFGNGFQRNATVVGSGTTAAFNISGASASRIQLGVGSTRYGIIYQDASNFLQISTTTSLPISFSTNNTERARITSGGYFKASNDGTYVNSTGAYYELRQTANSTGVYITATNASYASDLLYTVASRNTTNNSFYYFSCYNDGALNFRLRIADSGNVTNANGSYGTISDAKMKTDIVDAGSQWADIKAIRFRKFKMKDDPSGLLQLGVVAQELEQTSPGLVDEHVDRDAEGNDLGTTTKSVKTSILLMKAAKALQEAMTRIETLEAKVAALEGTQP